MPIEFACESCDRLLRVPDGSGGSQCECPACQTLLVIPDPDEVATIGDSASEASSGKIKIACPKCKHVLSCDPSLKGTKGQCLKCKYIFLISDDPAAVDVGASEWIFTCPKCDQLFEGSEEMRGRKGKCHSCGEVFAIELKRAKATKDSSLKPSEPKAKREASPETPKRSPDPSPSTSPASAPAPQPAPKPAPQPAPEPAPKLEPTPKTQPVPQPVPQGPPIQIACPSCEGVMEVPSSAAGQTTACPYCEQLLEIPDAEPTTQAAAPAPVPDIAPEPEWSGLEDLSGALGAPDPLGNANPYVAPAGNWEAPKTRVRQGLTFGDAFGLTFERAFPGSLMGGLIFIVSYIAAGVINWGISAIGVVILQSTGLDPTNPDQRVTFLTVFGIIVLIGAVIGLIIMGWGFSVICNGALLAMRKRNSSGELFEIGEAYIPIVGYLLLIAFIGSLPSLIFFALMQMGPALALPAGILVLVLSFLFYIFFLASCMAPFAILEGENPIEAIGTSLRVTAKNPLAVLGVIFCAYIIYVVVGLATCGIGLVFGVGFPFYAMAACYHLGTK